MHTRLKNALHALSRPFRRSATAPGQGKGPAFREKYHAFQELLDSNTELLKVISDIESKLDGRELFGMPFLRSRSSRVVFHALRLVKSFERLSGKPSPALTAKVETVRDAVRELLENRPAAGVPDLILPLSAITADMVDSVGGKCANLGEIHARAGLPVPAGFALTTAAFRAFFDHAGLWEEIGRIRMGLDPEHPGSVRQACEDIQHAILTASLPGELADALRQAHARLAGETGQTPETLSVALRSSALGEDGDMSFAGQYLSMLGVPAARLEKSYKCVLASLFTPRAVTYRALAGIPDETTAMAVACLEMVPAEAAGVLYSRDPLHAGEEVVLINAVFGLGVYAVDGAVTPDSYRVRRPAAGATGETALDILETRLARKTRMLCPGPDGVPADAPVPEDRQEAPCLDNGEITRLADMGLALEAHFGRPQDVEWAKTRDGRMLILQSRPLGDFSTIAPRPRLPEIRDHALLAEGGEPARPGAGCGPVFHVEADEDLERFPQGAVLVAAHSSPKFMVAMPRAAAIVTERGGVTGHMASLCREFGVPALLGLPGAMALPQGETVTVDAWSGKIYAGCVDALVSLAGDAGFSMKGSEVHGLLEKIAAMIVPLRLTNPKAPEFTETGCVSLHDVARYLHEKSYAEMFRISDMASGRGGDAVCLVAPTGLDLRIIDLGGGLKEEAAGKSSVTPDMVASGPFAALLDGLVLPSQTVARPKPVSAGGFFSVMREQMLTGPEAGAERFGDKSYAVISDKYLNFSSRVGYHYGVLDCYMGKTLNKNYISFSFKGGAADDMKRARRARAIAAILTRLGFAVELSGDRTAGRFHKAEPDVIRKVLTEMGRLLQYTRQTDMLMVSEANVKRMADHFFTGAYAFDPDDLGAADDAEEER